MHPSSNAAVPNLFYFTAQGYDCTHIFNPNFSEILRSYLTYVILTHAGKILRRKLLVIGVYDRNI
jgi:hypothetical protein